MARQTNPTVLRIPYIRSWPSLWHSERNYPSLLHQDLFIRKYLVTELHKYGIDLFKCVVKRTFNFIFISVFIFNTNSSANLQFKPFLFLRSFKFFRTLLDREAPRFSFAISKLTLLPNVVLNFRFIKYQKPNLFDIVLTSSPILLANYFFRGSQKMNSYKYALKKLRKIFKAMVHKKFNLKGLKIRVAGPVKAPRVRRAQTIKKIFFGTTPIQTFVNLIMYKVKTRKLSEGVVTLKLWLFKSLKHSVLLDPCKLVNYMRVVLAKYRKIRRYPRYNRFGFSPAWRIYIPRMNRIYYKNRIKSFRKMRG